MDTLELLENGLVDSLKLVKSSYTQNNMRFIKRGAFKKATLKNFENAFEFLKSFNSQKLKGIELNNFLISYNKSKTDFYLSVDNFVFLYAIADENNRFYIKEMKTIKERLNDERE